jgi:hypothetical protein
MEDRLIYITNPANLVSFVIFIFWLWVTWSNLNWRIKNLEKKSEEIDITKIETKLAKIEADLEWLKNARAEKHS